MELAIHACVAVFLWIKLLASQSWAQYADFYESSCSLTIHNVNGERMEILWNAKERFPDMNLTMFYKFDQQEEKQCPQYVHDQGYNTGCLFPTEGSYLSIYIKNPNGTEVLCYDEQESSKFFKPNPPENVTFQWAEDKITIQCKTPYNAHCFVFELRYKSRFDKDWQFRNHSCCEIKDQGFDLAKCYSFRFRLKHHHCSTVSYSSEWGVETFWKNGKSADSCAIDNSKPESHTVILLISVMAGFLVIFALLLYVCRLKRIRKILVPAVPDPKHVYSDLFSGHNGNFQEWISKTENVLVQTKVEYEEEECVIEEESGKDL